MKDYIPDIRDGLNTRQRKLLYGLYKFKYFSGGKKCRVSELEESVGRLFGRYEEELEEVLFDMSQSYLVNFSLSDFKGIECFEVTDSPGESWGCYSRLNEHSMLMFENIDNGGTPFLRENEYCAEEPEFLVCSLPILLVNGSVYSNYEEEAEVSRIPPHNLNEVIDGILFLVDNPDAEIDELMEFIKAPDFPTGGIVYAKNLKDVYSSGSGKVIVGGCWKVEKGILHISQLPYMQNRYQVRKNIIDVFGDKGMLEDLKDHTRDGKMDINVIFKKEYSDEEITRCTSETALQTGIEVETDYNFTVYSEGVSKMMTLKELCCAYIGLQRKRIIRINRNCENVDDELKRMLLEIKARYGMARKTEIL